MHNLKKTFGILLFILFIATALAYAAHTVKAMHSLNNTLILDPVYLPAIYKNSSPVNPFGVTVYSFIDAGGLAQAVEAGASWSRRDLIWSSIEPTETARIWNAWFDLQLINAAKARITPIIVIDGTPNWALKPGFECGAVAQEKFAALGNYAYDLVKRYSVPPYYVHYWELWNEPDVDGALGCWGDILDPEYYGGAYYGEMLKAVYPRIKEADPNAQVLVGGLLLDCDPVNPPEGKYCVPSRFLNGILASGAGPYFDGVSFHAYDFYTGKGTYDNPNWNSTSSTTGPVSIAKASYLRRVLSEYSYPSKYLLNTETAVFYGPNVHDPPCALDAPAEVEITKVDYIIQSYAVAVAEGWKMNVWYSLFGVRCSGLVNTDLSPRAGFYAYQFAHQKLGGASFVSKISGYVGIMGYEYETPGRKLWVLWSMDGQTHTINLPGLPLVVNRIGDDGKPVLEPNDTILNIGAGDLYPRLIEFGN